MVWNEKEHPRDDDGKFTFKNGGATSTSHMSREEMANILFSNTRKQKEENEQIQRRKKELLNILGKKATSADILYGTPKDLEKRIEEEGLGKIKGVLTGGASTVNNTAVAQKWERPAAGKITSKYGLRNDPKNGKPTFHYGWDIAVPIGTPVKSIAGGKVIQAGPAKGYGIAVYVDHGMINGKHVVSEYGHLSKCDVKVGDIVKAGQVVAKSGNSGKSTGPHLHVTIKENKVPVNPNKYL